MSDEIGELLVFQLWAHDVMLLSSFEFISWQYLKMVPFTVC